MVTWNLLPPKSSGRRAANGPICSENPPLKSSRQSNCGNNILALPRNAESAVNCGDVGSQGIIEAHIPLAVHELGHRTQWRWRVDCRCRSEEHTSELQS